MYFLLYKAIIVSINSNISADMYPENNNKNTSDDVMNLLANDVCQLATYQFEYLFFYINIF